MTDLVTHGTGHEEQLARPNQRVGSVSNAHAGRDFELAALRYFLEVENLSLYRSFKLPIGAGSTTKIHEFDLGSEDLEIAVECKSHTWTVTGKVPSSKMTSWNQAMYYFYLLPSRYRKIMFVLRDLRYGASESLVDYYLRSHGHLVPDGVEFWEYDPRLGAVLKVRA